MGYIDTHAHLNDEAFQDDLQTVVASARAAGAERLLLPATDLASTRQVLSISERFPGFCFPMIGLHPEEVMPDKMTQELSGMEGMLSAAHPFVAIGEIGLDFYWDATHAKEQCDAFEQQVEWALKYRLPLMIHCRKAHDELLSILSAFPKEQLRGVFHCFSGTVKEAEEFMDYPNFCLGIGGIVTFKKSTLPEVLSAVVPLNRIVLETDCPYMSPVPKRGKRNEPAFIPFIIEKLAAIYHTSNEEIIHVTTQNAMRLFFPKEQVCY